MVYPMDLPVPDQPVKITVGARYADTVELTVRQIADLVRQDVTGLVRTLKERGEIPRSVRSFVRLERGPGPSITVRLTAPRAWSHTGQSTTLAATRLVTQVEELREAYNRETLNTPADTCRYYGSTWVDGRE